MITTDDRHQSYSLVIDISDSFRREKIKKNGVKESFIKLKLLVIA